MRLLSFVLLSSCTLGLPESESRTVTLPDQLSGYRLNVPVGDVAVTSGAPVGIEATLRFRGSEAPTLQASEEGASVDHEWTCDRRCEVDLAITLPTETLSVLTIDLGTGDVEVADLVADEVTASVGTGRLEIGLEERPEAVTADVGTGDIRVVVPPGAYALDLASGLGPVDVDSEIRDDDGADASISAMTGVGSVRVQSR